jgi:hypothetical protein
MTEHAARTLHQWVDAIGTCEHCARPAVCQLVWKNGEPEGVYCTRCAIDRLVAGGEGTP